MKSLKTTKKWFLSGGLNIHNVDQALEQSGAYMIDISSGIEEVRGVEVIAACAIESAAVIRRDHDVATGGDGRGQRGGTRLNGIPCPRRTDAGHGVQNDRLGRNIVGTTGLGDIPRRVHGHGTA